MLPAFSSFVNQGLGGLMMKSELSVLPLIRQTIHDEMQVFLQKEASAIYCFFRNILIGCPASTQGIQAQSRHQGPPCMASHACHWMPASSRASCKLCVTSVVIGSTETNSRMISSSRRPSLLRCRHHFPCLVDSGLINRDFPRRATAPTITQIILIRRMMHTIFDPRAPGMQARLPLPPLGRPPPANSFHARRHAQASTTHHAASPTIPHRRKPHAMPMPCHVMPMPMHRAASSAKTKTSSQSGLTYGKSFTKGRSSTE